MAALSWRLEGGDVKFDDALFQALTEELGRSQYGPCDLVAFFSADSAAQLAERLGESRACPCPLSREEFCSLWGAGLHF